MKCFMIGFSILMTVAMMSLQLQQVSQREQIIALQTDNATQWNAIRLNSSCTNDHRVSAVEKNLKAFEKDNYKPYNLSRRQKDALDKRFGLSTGENRPIE